MFQRLLGRLRESTNKASTAVRLASADDLIAEGNQIEDAGDLIGAIEIYARALALAPEHPRAHLNLGIALAAQGDTEGAAKAYEAVLRIDPQHAFGNYNFARLAYVQEQFLVAESFARKAIGIKPDFHEAFVVLSNALDSQGKTGPAIVAIDEATRLHPDSAGVWFNQAVLLNKADRVDAAEVAIKRALELEPGNIDACKMLGAILSNHGLTTEALATLHLALEQDASRPDILTDHLVLLNCVESTDAGQLFEIHRAYGSRLEEAIPRRFSHERENVLERRRLKIGYVSGDFFVHPVSLFLIPVLERHSREGFEVFCYSAGPSRDHVTDQVERLCDRWVDVQSMSDRQLADRIHVDRIDILVDLSGHTLRSRLPAFIERPAPVQITWLGYLNTTGLSSIDYRLCDARTDPVVVSQPLHTERLVHLPNSQWCYRPFLEVAIAASAPFETNDYITFGSFNSPGKITPEMCGRWCRLLSRISNSRLLFANIHSERKRAAIRLAMTQFDISPERISFVPRVELPAYFELLNSVDIALDTFPYGGGTTTLDCLWMGVPVVTATGMLSVSRSAASILSLLGLDDWVASSVEGYVDVAEQRALDRPSIARLRRSLRQRMVESPLMDEVRFVQDLENAYRKMWAAQFASQDGVVSSDHPDDEKSSVLDASTRKMSSP